MLGRPSIAFHPKRQKVLSGGADGILRVWDVSCGVEIQKFGVIADKITGVDWSSDGRWIAGGTIQGKLNLWDWGAFEQQDAERIRRIATDPFNDWEFAGSARNPEAGRFCYVDDGNWVELHGDRSNARLREVQRTTLNLDLYDAERGIWIRLTDRCGYTSHDAQHWVQSYDRMNRRSATLHANEAAYISGLRQEFNPNAWPLSPPSERYRYHLEYAAEAELAHDFFAAAFQLTRLVQDHHTDPEIQRRLEAALMRRPQAPR